MPDGEVTRRRGLTAYLVGPTTRYRHGVLGDSIEAGGFVVERNDQRLLFRLGDDAVFEDRRVRLSDLDGDGQPEAIVIKSYLDRGSAIAVYRIGPSAIEPLAESKAIGQSNRWLNPVGIADFTGSGHAMIAAVVTPHLSGSLRLYRLSGSSLVEVTRIDGFTNHRSGQRDLDLARVGDVDGDGIPDVVIPTLTRNALATIGFSGGRAMLIGKTPVKQHVARFLKLMGQRATIKTDNDEELDIIVRRN